MAQRVQFKWTRALFRSHRADVRFDPSRLFEIRILTRFPATGAGDRAAMSGNVRECPAVDFRLNYVARLFPVFEHPNGIVDFSMRENARSRMIVSTASRS